MRFRSSLLPLLLLLAPFQSPPDSIRQHYEAAEARRRAGDLAAAEQEYAAILAEAYAKLGKIYAAQGRYSEAVPALEAAARYRPGDVDVLVDLAIAYFDADQFKRALGPLDAALARDPQSVGALHMRGKTYFMLGEFDRAAAELEAALGLAPNDYDISYTLGLVYLKQRQLAAAQEIYGRMLRRLGDRPQLHVLFGRAYRETGFLPAAIDEFKRAVALDPHFPRAHYYLGLTYLLKDGAARLDDAAAEFRFELQAHPEEFFANYYLGIVCAVERKWEQAVGFLEKASRIEPRNPDPYFHLGQAYQAIDKQELAIAALKKAIELNPSLSHNGYQVTTAHYRLGQSLLKAGRQAEGEKELQIAADLKAKSFARDVEKTETFLGAADLHEQNGKFPEITSVEGVIAEARRPEAKAAAELQSGADYYAKVVASAHNNVGLLRAARGDFPAAAEQFALAARWDPRLDGVALNWGLALFKAEQFKDAIPPLERALAADPNSVEAKQLLGLSYFTVEDYARATPLLTDAVSRRPNDVGLYFTLALSLAKQGKAGQADQVVRQMLTLGGDTPQLHVLLGQAYYEQNDTAKALEELRAALRLDPRLRLAHYYSGLIHLRAGRLDEAAREFESELALNPSDVQAKYHLGFALLAGQQTGRGIRLLREVIQQRPDYGDARYELGKALLQAGDVNEAVVNLEAAAKLEPDKSHVHYQLGRAYLAAGRQAEGESQLELSKRLKEKERGQTNP